MSVTNHGDHFWETRNRRMKNDREMCFMLGIVLIEQKPSHKDLFIPGEKRILKIFYEARDN